MSPAIVRRTGLEGAAAASGPTVVIDSYRAFCTAAYLLDAGVARLVLTDDVEDARHLAAADGALLCGEEDGRRPDDFDIGNSPTEVVAYGTLRGASVVMCTTAGTRCVVAAVEVGAAPVYAASLLVAGATARALGGAESVTIVSSGGSVTTPHDEDELTGDLIAARLRGAPIDVDRLVSEILGGAGTKRLRAAAWIDDADIDRCLEVDRFDFSLRVDDSSDLVTVSMH
jgi:2-phosphosulfolactate phosphatase